jgi:hypothetical protein
MTHAPDLHQSIRDLLLRDLKKKAIVFHKLKGGRNSQVFRVDCGDGSVLAVKAYFQSPEDPRDRLGCEFRALQFLKSEGLREIATPLAADEVRRIAVYEFVAGDILRAEEIGNAEIDQAVAFLRALKTIADSGNAAHFPAASEACFSISAILQNLDARYRRLDEAAVNRPALKEFLCNELVPSRQAAGRRCYEFCGQHRIATEVPIPLSERTLSPSDFGFHNAIRRAGGRLVFLDLEYFGWDDPAKTVADFLLHPGMQLAGTLKRRFCSRIAAAFASVRALPLRVRAVYPLFALKWCAILLNDFALEHRARRCFADGAHGALNETVQIETARRMLAQVTNDDHDSPWHT